MSVDAASRPAESIDACTQTNFVLEHLVSDVPFCGICTVQKESFKASAADIRFRVRMGWNFPERASRRLPYPAAMNVRCSAWLGGANIFAPKHFSAAWK